MKKSTTMLFSFLLVSTSHVFANRPGVEDRPAEERPIEDTQSSMTATQTTGDALEITKGETINIKLIDFPRRGMSMDKVLNELGKPTTISKTVGNPPITNWVYKGRTIYFENSTVIHVVATP